ncbi:MAG TPA: ABC transporter permease [Treponemataceae bacterium]|nr:ABC transporter permease [Treponemataceae bacterium]HPS43156.1 ABC transporter permease [Treponemataceae bacterium]
MTAFKIVEFSFRSIFRNRMRSLLTSLGIIIGVCSVIVMVAVGEGSQKQITKQIASMGTNLINVMPMRGPEAINTLSRADVKKIRTEASLVQAISGITRGSFDVVGGTSSWETSVMGVEPDYLVIKNWGVGTGAFFTEQDLASRSKVAVIGKTVAKELFGQSDPIGSSIRIGTTPFTVVAVLAEKGSTGMGDDQDDVIMVPLDTALARLSKSRNLGMIAISVVRDDLMDRAQTEIDTILRESHRLSATATADYSVMNMADIIKTASQTSKSLTMLLAAIAGVSLVVGGIGIMNIMLVSVTERTREIGIRMSVGARRRDILFQFLSESVILSLMGGMIGIVLAVTLCKVLTAFVGLPTSINPMVIAASAGFAGAVGIFFGYYPARKAAGLYPIDALRYE